MKAIELLKEMNNTEFLDKIYQFAYRRETTIREHPQRNSFFVKGVSRCHGNVLS